MFPILDDNDTLVPDPQVREEFGISEMTEWRWDRDPEMAALGWPEKVKIRKRNYRSRNGLNEFRQNLLRRAVQERKAGRAAKRSSISTKRKKP